MQINGSAPSPFPAAGAMSSILCAASKSQCSKKKKTFWSKTKAPNKKVIYCRLQNPLMREPKNSHMHTLAYKTKTQSHPLFKSTCSFLS